MNDAVYSCRENLVAKLSALFAFIVDSCSRRRPACEAPARAVCLHHRPRLMQIDASIVATG
jgi:hypothetical protein